MDGASAYTWDRANRLLSVGNTAFAYAYNGVGQRIQQSVGATITQYLLDTQPGLFQVLTETTDANVTRYVQGPMGLQQIQQPSTAWQQVIPDALGSVRGVVDASNALLDTRLYAPYGEVFGPTGSSQTAYGFTGEPTDGNGLVYLRARYYNPGLGVFTGLDPLEGEMVSTMSLNRYMYIYGDVVNAIDPSGMLYERPEQRDPCAQQDQQFEDCSCYYLSDYLRDWCLQNCQKRPQIVPTNTPRPPAVPSTPVPVVPTNTTVPTKTATPTPTALPPYDSSHPCRSLVLSGVFGDCGGCEPRKNGYGYGDKINSSDLHPAIDITPKAVTSTPFDKKWNEKPQNAQFAKVYAVTSGKLKRFADDGAELIPDHPQMGASLEFVYVHIDFVLSPSASGTPVLAGQQIGVVRSYDKPTTLETSDWSHLHFGLRYYTKPFTFANSLDPEECLINLK